MPSLPLPRTSVEDGDPVFAVENAPTLAGLRHQLGAVLATLVPDREQQEDLHLAASEIAANAFRHGVRPVSARVWADGDRVVCVISDRGTVLRATRSAGSPRRTASTSPAAAWACGWPASSGTTSTCCPPTTGLSVRLSTRPALTRRSA